ncbi:ciliated left-right organizer metallopeptidase-like [Mercenaria mercenaria]|uniref:ciliated left-right organizer metallopeptidase-like n=1 Tax=Mercenaria mercenaria TaxID=6596 RepID=UPI00234F7404|nr:ciliated left-right organizer metallopeptidase-like [Mercenaria mercenaria]
MYRPLRIYPYFGDNLKYELSDQEAQILKNTINNVILYVKKILSVIPTEGYLLLERNACKSSWTGGRNAGKCASIRKDYVGEFCLDNFMIPDEHLEAFYTWTNRPLPDRTWYTDGVGVKNADYILYVQARTTKSCMTNFSPESTSTLMAYASYCKLGKNDRPIAGYINFCASEFKKYKSNRNKRILITLHEVFHALGFSKDLILNFRDFRQETFDTVELPHYSFPILRENNGTYWLLTPTVVSKMQEQFACQETGSNLPEGAPMTDKENVLQSHWDSSFLPGSVMSSKLGEPEYTFVDPITLAVFRDTGWYDVNFAYGDDYLWGKKKGCNFLKSLNSKEIPDLQKQCSVDFSSGCNYLQTEVINCENSELFSTSDAEEKSIENCRFNSSGSFYEAESSLDVGRCILYEKNLVMNGRCVVARCSVGDVYIKLRSIDPNWVKCSSGEIIEDTVEGGFVTCPVDEESFCARRNLPVYLQDLVTLEATTVTERPRATYPVTQGNMYSVEEITNSRTANIGQSCSTYSTNVAKTIFLLFVVKLIINL